MDRRTGRKLAAMIVVVAAAAVGVMLFRFLPAPPEGRPGVPIVYAARGCWQDAIKRNESVPAGILTRPNFQMAISYVHTGQIEKGRRILAELEELSWQRYIDQAHLAAIYAVLGEKEKARADRSARVSTPRFYQWLEPLFNDPRFAELEYKVAHSPLLAPMEGKP